MQLHWAIYLLKVSFLEINGVSMSHPVLVSDGRGDKDDYSAFNEVWDKPDDGMHGYLYRFLTSPDATFQHIAVWTIVQLLESEGTSNMMSLSYKGADVCCA